MGCRRPCRRSTKSGFDVCFFNNEYVIGLAKDNAAIRKDSRTLRLEITEEARLSGGSGCDHRRCPRRISTRDEREEREEAVGLDATTYASVGVLNAGYRSTCDRDLCDPDTFREFHEVDGEIHRLPGDPFGSLSSVTSVTDSTTGTAEGSTPSKSDGDARLMRWPPHLLSRTTAGAKPGDGKMFITTRRSPTPTGPPARQQTSPAACPPPER